MAKSTSFKNILGTFALDKNLKIENNKSSELEEIKDISDSKRIRLLSNFKNKLFLKDFRDKNLQLTKEKIKESFTQDILVIQASKSIEELDKTINSHVKRLREWFSYAVPELSELHPLHEEYIDEILKFKSLPKEFDMSLELPEEHLKKIKEFAQTIKTLYNERNSQIAYLEKLVAIIAPNLTAVAGTNVGAKLLALSGNLKRLSRFPAPKIQLMGAEVALFRHLQTGAKPPKHGVILEHPLVSGAKKYLKGKIARKLADKISIATKIDYFKGEFMGDILLENLKKDIAKLDKK